MKRILKNLLQIGHTIIGWFCFAAGIGNIVMALWVSMTDYDQYEVIIRCIIAASIYLTIWWRISLRH